METCSTWSASNLYMSWPLLFQVHIPSIICTILAAVQYACFWNWSHKGGILWMWEKRGKSWWQVCSYQFQMVPSPVLLVSLVHCITLQVGPHMTYWWIMVCASRMCLQVCGLLLFTRLTLSLAFRLHIHNLSLSKKKLQKGLNLQAQLDLIIVPEQLMESSFGCWSLLQKRPQ